MLKVQLAIELELSFLFQIMVQLWKWSHHLSSMVPLNWYLLVFQWWYFIQEQWLFFFSTNVWSSLPKMVLKPCHSWGIQGMLSLCKLLKLLFRCSLTTDPQEMFDPNQSVQKLLVCKSAAKNSSGNLVTLMKGLICWKNPRCLAQGPARRWPGTWLSEC